MFLACEEAIQSFVSVDWRAYDPLAFFQKYQSEYTKNTHEYRAEDEITIHPTYI